LIRHRGHHDGCRMRSRKCLPFRSTWFHLWFSYSLVFCLLSFDCSFCLTAWYLYIFYLYNLHFDLYVNVCRMFLHKHFSFSIHIADIPIFAQSLRKWFGVQSSLPCTTEGYGGW